MHICVWCMVHMYDAARAHGWHAAKRQGVENLTGGAGYGVIGLSLLVGSHPKNFPKIWTFPIPYFQRKSKEPEIAVAKSGLLLY